MTRTVTRKPLIALSAAALATALVGCANGDDEAPADEGVGTNDDGNGEAAEETDPEDVGEGEGAPFEMAACDLMTAEDLADALGVEFEEGEQPDAPTFDDECIFEVASEDEEEIAVAYVTVTETHHLPDEDAEWESMREVADIQEELEGIGDDAFIEDGPGGTQVQIRTEGAQVGAFGIDIDEWEDNAAEIAELIDANL